MGGGCLVTMCEDAPCCGCCGQIAWAREDEAMAQHYMDWADREWDDYEPDEENEDEEQ